MVCNKYVVEDFDGAEVGFTKGVEVDHVLEEWFDLYACEIEGFCLFSLWRFGFLFLLGTWFVERIHCWNSAFRKNLRDLYKNNLYKNKWN